MARCCQGISAALIPTGLGGLSLSPSLRGLTGAVESGAQFHLHPHYRSPRPLDATLAKTHAGQDEFISEKYAEQIALILARWSTNLLDSHLQLSAIAASLTGDFAGASLLPAESRQIRGAPVVVWQNKFAQSSVRREAFLADLHSALSEFSAIGTAQLEITRIDGSRAPTHIDTRVRYELVGSGKLFHREQRVGYWQL
ncbi:MAG TPA: hypothetical protein VEI99_06745, partial [Terriglobales bacterium]|nr:hypothetical protein [Terriglobales bacterium]